MSLIFDGHNLEDLFFCGNPDIVLTNPAPVLNEVGGRDGAVVRSTRLAAKSIKFDVTALGNSQERATALSALAGWLNVDGPVRLYLPDTSDHYYLVVPYNSQQIKPYIDGGTVTLEFMAVEPAAYGETKTATVPSGGNVSINIGGNYPTFLSGNGSVKRGTNFYTITADTGEKLEIPADTTAKAVVFNCEDRTLTVAGVNTLPSVDSDWLRLAPGEHTITNSQGTNAITIKWTERWL